MAWSRRLSSFGLLTVSLNAMVGVGLFLAAIPILDQNSDLTLLQIGILAGAFPLAESLAALFYVFVRQIGNPKTLLLAGQMCCLISAACLALTLNFEILLVSRIVGGIGGASLVVAQGVVGRQYDGDERVVALGLLSSMQPVGFMIGLLLVSLGIWIAPTEIAALRGGALLAGAMALIAVCLISAASYPSFKSTSIKTKLRLRPLTKTLLLYLLNTLSYIGLAVLTSVWAGRTPGVGSQGAALIFLALATTAWLFQARLVGPAIRKLGPARTIVWGFTLSAIGALLFSLNFDTVASIAGLFIARAGFSLLVPTLLGRLMDSDVGNQPDKMAAIAMVMSGLGAFAGPVIVSTVIEASAVAYAGLFLFFVSAVGFATVFFDRNRRNAI